MESYHFQNFTVTLDQAGSREFTKASYPIRYGRFAEIRTGEHLLQFNLNGEIKYLQGLGQDWPHPAEWLKRTPGDDWVYYSSGDYQRVFDLFGEYYFPCLSYQSNALMPEDPFTTHSVRSAIRSWERLPAKLKDLVPTASPKRLKEFLSQVIRNDAEALQRRAQQLHHLIGGPVSVLPPDTRHVDYEVIPVVVADGCLYQCGFCRVKSGHDFSPRSWKEIVRQMKNLRRFYGRDLNNYNAIFLGQHDALQVGRELLEAVGTEAYSLFELDRSYLRGAYLFLFGSVSSMMNAKEDVFQVLNRLPYSTCINIGLESVDPATLAVLKKPLSVEAVRDTFARIVEVNRKYEKLEVTANFVVGEDLPSGHLPSLFELTGHSSEQRSPKGCIYLSPLVEEKKPDRETRRKVLKIFQDLKTRTRFPVYLYLIQRM